MNQTFSIRVWHKLLVLGLIAAVLCAVPTSLYVIASNKDIRSALQEIKGLNPATKLVRTTQLLQAHRGYAAAILSGNAALSQQRLSTQKEVTAALADVRAALPATATPVIQALDKVNAEWDSLSNALKEQGFPVEDSYNRHTKLIGGLMNVLEINLDFHGLTLDPEASTSYLINAAFQDLPRLIESLGRMRATGTAILGIKQATTEERVTIATMLERSRQDLEHSGALIRKAVEANGAALPAIEAATAAALSETQKFLAVTDLEFMRIEVLRYNPEDYQKMGGAGIDAQFKLIDTSRTEIEHMLNERVSNYRRDRTVLLGMIAILALFGAMGIFWIARSITRPLSAAIEDANAIAAGRLDSAVQNVGKGEVGQLRLAMKQMQQNLAHIVFSIRENSESVATASREIASSTRDMSARVESQASSLEETAASMEELNSTFHKNDESSQHVTDLAAQAAEAAEQGGTVVGKVTRTMQEIDVSSKKIAEIIAVIDGIAFQTNILALNAAVEAARAGEQGRGFAVVASEVRALAQRSGQASKEIRALISDSVKKVQAGTREAVDSGKVMDEILASVRKVAATMKDMQTVRGDQRRGVSQVSQAVEQMNQGTQQSAAMVEQIAATADMLSDQAQDLNEAVAVFKLSGEEEKGRSVKRNDYATGTDTDDGFTEADLPDRPISKSIADALPNGATRPMLTSRPH